MDDIEEFDAPEESLPEVSIIVNDLAMINESINTASSVTTEVSKKQRKLLLRALEAAVNKYLKINGEPILKGVD